MASAGASNQPPIDFPPPQEVAGRACLIYLREGSRHGHDLEHWLNAELELLSERNRTRVIINCFWKLPADYKPLFGVAGVGRSGLNTLCFLSGPACRIPCVTWGPSLPPLAADVS